MSYGYLELNNTQRLHSIYETVSLGCPIQGIPKPVKYWYFNLTQIKLESSVYEIDNRTGSLKIKEIDKSSEGLYVCKSYNEYGAASFAQSIELAGNFYFLFL